MNKEICATAPVEAAACKGASTENDITLAADVPEKMIQVALALLSKNDTARVSTGTTNNDEVLRLKWKALRSALPENAVANELFTPMSSGVQLAPTPPQQKIDPVVDKPYENGDYKGVILFVSTRLGVALLYVEEPPRKLVAIIKLDGAWVPAVVVQRA